MFKLHEPLKLFNEFNWKNFPWIINDLYNDNFCSTPLLSRPSNFSSSSVQLDLDPTATSEIIMAEPQSSPALISSNQPQKRCEENSQSTRIWRARDYYDLIGEHDEFAKCKVCSNNGKEKIK